NCPWSVEEAIRVGRRLERFDLRWLEEPVWPPEDYAGLARVREALRIPIAAGENDATVFGFRELIAQGAADIVQPSVTKVGGLLEMKKIAVLAAAANVPDVSCGRGHPHRPGDVGRSDRHRAAALQGIRSFAGDRAHVPGLRAGSRGAAGRLYIAGGPPVPGNRRRRARGLRRATAA